MIVRSNCPCRFSLTATNAAWKCRWARRDPGERARRLRSIPGVGPRQAGRVMTSRLIPTGIYRLLPPGGGARRLEVVAEDPSDGRARVPDG